MSKKLTLSITSIFADLESKINADPILCEIVSIAPNLCNTRHKNDNYALLIEQILSRGESYDLNIIVLDSSAFDKTTFSDLIKSTLTPSININKIKYDDHKDGTLSICIKYAKSELN